MMAFEKHGDAMPGTVFRTPKVNTTAFVRALTAHGVSQETADGVARAILALAVSGGRPPTWPVTREVMIGVTPHTVVADLNGDLLVLVSIKPSGT
jgi:hypothetical protein